MGNILLSCLILPGSVIPVPVVTDLYCPGTVIDPGVSKINSTPEPGLKGTGSRFSACSLPTGNKNVVFVPGHAVSSMKAI